MAADDLLCRLVMDALIFQNNTFLNLGFWARLKGRPSDIIRSAM